MTKPFVCLLALVLVGAAAAAHGVEVGYCSPLKDLEAVKAAGFDYAELRTSEVAALSDAEFETLALRLQRLALPVPVTYLFVPREVRLTGPDVDEAVQTAYVRKALDRVARLGARTVVLGSGPARNFPDGFPKADAYRQFVGFCKRVGIEARSRGITIAIEPQRKQESNLINNLTEGLALVRDVADPNVQLTADFFHVAEEKEDPGVVLTAREHIRHVHTANPVKRVFPLHWDEFDYAPFFANLRKIGYAGRISLEASSGDFAREAPVSIALLKRALTSDPDATSFKFDLRANAAPGFTAISASTSYSDDRGYGFDFATRPGGDRPFFFSVAVPEGNYRVTVTLGGPKAATTTVRAESRRLVAESVATRAGSFDMRTFTVNVRNSRLRGGGSVRLNDRELGVLHWDDKLTLEFAGSPAVATIEIARVENAVTVFLAGDSTVTDQTREPWAAWGQMLPRFFTPDVAIANHAESGETLIAFVNEGRLEKLLSQMKAGDFLFIQFNHNDQKPGPNYAAPFAAYQEHLKSFIGAARKRRATPVLVTSMLRRRFDDEGRIINTLGDYPEAMRQTANEEGVALIDLNAASKVFYEALGPENSKRAFVHYPADAFPDQPTELKDDTHFNPYGAYQLAKVIVEGIRSSVPDLAKHLVAGLPAYDPAKPDPSESWIWPLSPPLPQPKAGKD